MKQRSMRMTGFTLLPVVLAMSLIAAIAFLLNRDNGMNIDMVSSQMDADRAHYAAEAGLQAANAKIQTKNCLGGYPTVSTPVTNNNFGGASYSAYATSSGGNTTSLISTGSYNDSSITLTRNNIYAYQSAAKTYTLQPDAIAGLDTFIDAAAEKNYGKDSKLPVKKDQQNLLFKFDLSAFPAGSRPVSSTFSIYASSDPGINSIDYYRMNSDWAEGTGASSPLDGATWNTSNGGAAWTPGGNYYPVKINPSIVITVSSQWANFDATDITTAWLSGQYPNYGVIIKSAGEIGSVKYYSSDNSDAVYRPKITFNYLLPCGATGPSDTAGGTVTLSPTADSFNDSGAVLANNGAATSIKTYYTSTRENRILMQFNTSSIPSGSIVQSAKLRMYVGSVSSPSANTKPIWANAINESWAEGTGINTNKACPTLTAGTSWNYRTNCTNWSFIHPPNTAPGWTTRAHLPVTRTGHVMETVNNKIYVIGGSNISAESNALYEYNPATDVWTTKSPMPTPRWWATSAVVNGKIYVIGGEKSNVSQAANEVYDPATDKWKTMQPMPTARKGQAAAVVNNKIYLFGGGTTLAATKTNFAYDPATDTWASNAPMPTARFWPTATAANDKIYVFGGSTGAGGLDKNEVYDPASDTWSTKASMPVRADAMTSEILGNKIYLIAGRGSFNTPLNSVYIYDTLNDSYSTALDYPISIFNPNSTLYNNKIYVTGGFDGASVSMSHYQYDSGQPVPVATASEELTAISPLAAGFTSGWINFDLKPLVQEWVDGVRPNNGVIIYTDMQDQFSINSRENSSNNPQLIVKY